MTDPESMLRLRAQKTGRRSQRLRQAGISKARSKAHGLEQRILGRMNLQYRVLADRVAALEDSHHRNAPLLAELQISIPQQWEDSRQQTANFTHEIQKAREEFAALGEAIAPASGLPAVAPRMAELRERLYALERRVRQLTLEAGIDASRPTATPSSNPSAPAVGESTPSSVLFDYTGFERRFRGDPAIVNQTLWDRYGDLLSQHAPVVDLGCGRAELVERLLASEVSVRGVDSDPMLVADAQGRGLPVELGDVISWLNAQEAGSLGAIIATHVVEHLPLDVLIRLLELSASRLAPGGVLVAETPNPTSLIVLGNSYLLDPTHVRPLHPALLGFLCEGAGFRGVRLEFFAPATGYHVPLVTAQDAPETASQINDALRRLNDTLFGPQDYAVIATKG